MQPLLNNQTEPFTQNLQRCDDIESCNSVHVITSKEGCLCCSYLRYTVLNSQTQTPILAIETESMLKKCCSFCAPYTVHIYSLVGGKRKIGTYTPPACASLTCRNGLRTTVDGHNAGGIQTVFHKCMCLCCCPNYVYDIVDSNEQRQYVIGNDGECKCLCLNCSGCLDNCLKCCGEFHYRTQYDIHERDMNNKPTGGFLVDYMIKSCCCLKKYYYPVFDIDFPPNTPRDAKLSMLALCTNFS